MKYISGVRLFEDLPEGQKIALAEVKVAKTPVQKFTLADFLAAGKTPLYPAVRNKDGADGFYYVELSELKGALLQVGIGAVGNVMDGDKLVLASEGVPAIKVLNERAFNIHFAAVGGKWRASESKIAKTLGEKANTL